MVEMKNIVIAKGTFGATNATLTTVAAGKKFIVKEIILANVTGGNATADLTFDGVRILKGKEVYANDNLFLSLSAVIDAAGGAKTIQGQASAASTIDYYISGVEVAEVAD